MVPLLQVKNLDIAFEQDKNQTIATDKVSFSVNPSQILCVVGESGCGKSITALSVMGLLSHNGHVIGGEVFFEGKDLLQMNEKELDQIRGNKLAMVFQDVMNSLNPVFTIGNQLIETIRVHLGYDKKTATKYALELLKKVDLPNPEAILKKYPHMLSGGMRQRVMIAMAIACHPKLIIADEPTTALDVTIQLQIMKLLMQLREEYQMSMILITHDIGVVAELADRVVVMYAGQCVEEADVKDIFEKPAHPYTQALLKAIPGIHDDKNQKLLTIAGTVPERYQDIKGCRFAQRCPLACEACSGEQAFSEIESRHFVRCHLAVSAKEAVFGA
jgi:oligopeptide/dipeptide ABC transporter ATP-binding protein